ncbi:MAG: peptide ABC transporter substrate-binding protein [Proteobacteria bacterium]|nr:peptide ABC transporter substrate-binding protein [Pseudomonadota bacterium]
MLRRLLFFVCLVFASPVFASPAFAMDELVIGMSTAPGTLNPLLNSMLAGAFINSMTERPITVFDPDWKLVCLLCTELPTVENGHARIVDLPPDDKGVVRKGMEVDIELRPMTWGDGTPVTARDFQFTIDVGRHPQSGVPSVEDYRRILKVEIKDDRHFTITRDRVTFDYNVLDFFPLPAHIEKPIFDADPAEYRTRTTYDADPANPGLAYGPYRVVEVVPGSRIALERNPHWSGAPPQFRRILIKFFENSSSLEANLLSGNVDYVPGESGLSFSQSLAFEQRHADRYNVVFKPSLTYGHIDVNLDNPLLGDVRVRRAILMAIDRKTISDKLFHGKQPVADGNVNPLDPMYSPAARPYAYDPAQAKELLDEAGFRQVATGERRNARGQRLSLVLDYASGNRASDQVAQVIQSELRRVGIELRLKAAPARIYFGNLNKRKFDSLAFYSWVTSPGSVPRTTLHSTEIPSAENGWSGQNFPGYRNPEMDRALDGAERELDPVRRRAFFADILRLYADDLPALPMYFRVDSFVIPKTLTGVVPTGHQGCTSLWIENWRWRD